MFMTVENSVKVLNDPSSSLTTYYTDDQTGRRGFIVSVEPAAAKVSSTNFEAAAVFASKNSTLLDLERSNKEIDKARLATVKKLWQITEQMNILYPENWTRIAAQELATFQETMVNVLVKEWQKAALPVQQIRTHNDQSKSSSSSISSSSRDSSKHVKSDQKNVKNKEPDKNEMDGKSNDKIRYFLLIANIIFSKLIYNYQKHSFNTDYYFLFQFCFLKERKRKR